MKLILASKNKKKLIEMEQILSSMGAQPVLQADVGLDLEPEETGTTFLQNAEIKARAVMEACGMAAIADDSGIVIDALDGEPGVYSARYGGEVCKDDVERYELVLEKMKNVPEGERSARFVSAIVCVLPGGETISAEGYCEGVITFAPKGEGGFGYDPIFYIPELKMTMAEITPQAKNTISHRAMALKNFQTKWKERIQNADK